MQTIEEKLNNKSMISARPESVTTSTSATAGNQTKIPLEQVLRIGNRLSIDENGGIKIGKDVSVVAISANMSVQNVSGVAGIRRLQIIKNDEIVTNVTTYIENTITYFNLSQSRILLEVQENDVIYLAHSASTTGDVIARSYTGSVGSTFITVEKVC